MSTYRHAVLVRQHPYVPGVWTWDCPCGDFAGWHFGLPRAHHEATHHAAACESLHRANWDAACPSCRSFGKPAKACMTCLTRRPL